MQSSLVKVLVFLFLIVSYSFCASGIVFFSDATLLKEQSKHFPYKDLKLRLDEENGHTLKVFKGEYWEDVYKFNSAVNSQDFVDEVKKFIKSKGGKVVFSGRDYVYCYLKVDEGEFWANVTYDSFDRDKYIVKIVQTNKKVKDRLSFGKGKRIVLHGVYFDSGKDTLKDKSKEALSKIYQLLKDNPNINVEIQGHTDNVGDKEENKKLSLKRAKKVKEALVKMGIDEKIISVQGFGDSKPIASNDTKEGRAKNRRVELVKVDTIPDINIENIKGLKGYKKEIKRYKDVKFINDKLSIDMLTDEHRAMFTLTSSDDRVKPYEILQNYKNYIKKLGGEVLLEKNNKIYFQFEKTIKNDKIFGKINVNDGFYYISFFYPKKED